MKMICEVPDAVIKCIKDGTYCGSGVAEKMIANGTALSSSEKPCEDCISRQAVLKIIDGWYEQNRDTDNIEDLIVLITYMDSVNPQKPICPSAGVDCEDCPAYEPKTDWIVSIILTDEKGEEHDGLMDMRRMLIYLHNIPAETAISLGYTWKSAEGGERNEEA